MHVQTGDVAGVSLLTSNSLPIVASGATGYSLMAHTALNAPMMLLTSDPNQALNMALHFYPTIDKLVFIIFIFVCVMPRMHCKNLGG